MDQEYLELRIKIYNGSDIQLAIDKHTTLEELFDFLLENKMLEYTKQYWSCYSSSSQSFYTESFKPLWIDKLEDELLFIPTSQVNKFGPNMSDKVRLQSQNPAPTLQNESNIAMVTEGKISQETGRQISLYIQIEDGTLIRTFPIKLNEYKLLDQVAEAVMNYQGLESEYATVDLFYQSKPLNSCKKRRSTLKELFAGLDNKIYIQARVRWFGG